MLHGKGDFTDVIKDSEKSRLPWITLNVITTVLTTGSRRVRGRGDLATKAEVRVR